MSPTTQAFLAAVLGAVVAAVAVYAWHVTERQQQDIPAAPQPDVPPEVATVLSVLRSSAVIVDHDDSVLKASAPAYALGLVRGSSLLSDELIDLVRQVRRDGQIRETEVLIARTNAAPRHVTARIAPIGSRLTLVLVEDRTRERRIEAVRRDFVANVSHELKTPVGAIRVLADAVSEAADDPEAVRRFSHRMLTESDRLTALVLQIIELSRLQGDEPLESPEVVDVDQIIASAADTTSVDAARKGISIRIGGTSGLTVFGSEEQVLAAVTNLVSNAVAYSDAGLSVTISARATDDNVEISVIDQGIGIAPAEIDRIFERFYRVDPARHRSTGGTGLGLSIVKHVAATHGGDVKVWSSPGRGSTFTLILPQHTSSPTADEADHEPLAPELSGVSREDRP